MLSATRGRAQRRVTMILITRSAVLERNERYLAALKAACLSEEWGTKQSAIM